MLKNLKVNDVMADKPYGLLFTWVSCLLAEK